MNEQALLGLADDELVLGWRDSEWTGIAPLLEEDVAFSSIAQNEIGHARAVYSLLSDDPDALAFDREETYHRLHAEMWADRLRDEPRFQEALEELWPEALGMLDEDLRPALAGRFPDLTSDNLSRGIARGEHAEEWPALWEEMTMVRRVAPGASW